MVLAYIIIIIVTSGHDSLGFKLDSVYYRYQPVAAESLRMDSISRGSDPSLMPDTGLSRVLIRGVKDFTYDLQDGFDQGLQMSLRGTVAGTEIEGVLSDQSVSGPTTRIADLEKVRLTAASRYFQGGLGMLSLELPFGITDEINGGMAAVHDSVGINRIHGAYAVSRGTFRRIEFQGEEGKQSPYFVPGRILPGSERVFCSQGMLAPALLVRDFDYTVNYEQSIISFTNRNIITARTRLIVEYQDAMQDWASVYQEADARTRLAGNEIQTMIRRAYDDHREPLGFNLSPAEWESLAVVGDSARVSHVYADTAADGSYRLENGHFVYYGPGLGTHRVSFFYAGENGGEYVYDPVQKGFVYVGLNAGNYTPARRLTLPADQQFYAVEVSTVPGLRATYFGSRYDRNTFSPINDEDNQARGWRLIGRQRLSFLSGGIRYLKYDPDLTLPFAREDLDYHYAWNTTDPLNEEGRLELLAALRSNLSVKADYGILNRRYKRWSAEIQQGSLAGGYRRVDTLDTWFLAGQKTWRRLRADLRYENCEQTHYTTYDFRWPVEASWYLGCRGDYERRNDYGLTTCFDFYSAPVEISIGRRKYQDSTYQFGDAAVRLSGKGINLTANLRQSQTYLQKQDEYYEPVPDGSGDYVYDSLTGSYRPKTGGDHVKRIILLEDFQRVTSHEYGCDLGYHRDRLETRGRFSALSQKGLQQFNEDFLGSWTGDEWAVEIAGTQNRFRDERYLLNGSDRRERRVELRPRYHRGYCGLQVQQQREQWGDFQQETRTDYGVRLGTETGRKLSFRPEVGYSYVLLASAYFPGLDLRLQIPRAGLTAGYPVFQRGRAEAGAEFIYRRFSTPAVPYFFAAGEPPGLTKILTMTAGFSVSSATIFNLTYRLEMPPQNSLLHHFKLSTRIVF